jgi:hypothetical protein
VTRRSRRRSACPSAATESAVQCIASEPDIAVRRQIRQIVESDSWQLRYPIGPDVVPFLKWRASKTDEEVVNQAAESDPDYKARVKREFGLDLDL